MRSASTHPARLWRTGAALLALAALLAIAIVATGSGAPSRAALLNQLERPAAAMHTVSTAARVGPGPVAISLSAADYHVAARLGPNRATRADVVSITLTRGQAPVNDASVAVSYSMPSMNMWNVLTTQLRAIRAGRYSAREPELAMAGHWQVRFEVSPAGAAPFALTVDDRMRS